MKPRPSLTRREFFGLAGAGALAPLLAGRGRAATTAGLIQNPLFSVTQIPDLPFTDASAPSRHLGVETLLQLMGRQGLKFYRSALVTSLGGPQGLVAADDVVLLKVNAQWKYRGATSSDVVRGIVQRVLEHPDGFRGEVVIFENGQGRGSLNCDTRGGGTYADNAVHANAVDERHSFLYLVDQVFKDPRVSAYLLDPVRGIFIGAADHVTQGYRKLENVSYPCFTTARGTRVELKEGIWTGAGYAQNLKLINVPVLKTHGGSEITGALKHFYGVLSMDDGQSSFRHYAGHGETVGKMVALVRPPVLNVLDCVWVSHGALGGYPAGSTFKANRLVGGQDPLAIDYWASKHILYPVNKKAGHNPDNATIQGWMNAAQAVMNGRSLKELASGLQIDAVTKNENEILVYEAAAGTTPPDGGREPPQAAERDPKDRAPRKVIL
jgi:uncharacterized protein (DUF362 family)